MQSRRQATVLTGDALIGHPVVYLDRRRGRGLLAPWGRKPAPAPPAEKSTSQATRRPPGRPTSAACRLRWRAVRRQDDKSDCWDAGSRTLESGRRENSGQRRRPFPSADSQATGPLRAVVKASRRRGKVRRPASRPRACSSANARAASLAPTSRSAQLLARKGTSGSGALTVSKAAVAASCGTAAGRPIGGSPILPVTPRGITNSFRSLWPLARESRTSCGDDTGPLGTGTLSGHPIGAASSFCVALW
jgi:hypothetical protein